MRKKYKNPPITELVIGVYLAEPILDFRAEHVGLYWSKISDEFPNSYQNLMLGGVDLQAPREVFPLPRFWFVSKDEMYLIQVQRNAFLFNWRKQEDEYPHYEALKKEFDKHYAGFLEFCRSTFGISDLPIGQCELTYINMIEDQDYFKSFSDTKKIIPSYAPPSVDHIDPTECNVKYVYPVDHELSLAVQIQSRRNVNTGKEVLYFELRSSGIFAEHKRSIPNDWFDRAHEVIGNAFNSLTNREIQDKYWQVKDN